MSILFVPKADKFDKITCLPPLVLAILHKVFSSLFPGFLPVFLPDLLSDNVCAVKRRCPSKRCYGQSGYESWAAGIWFPYLWDSFSSAANWEFVEGSAPRTTLSFRTSAHTGVGISIEFQIIHRHTNCSILPFPGILPRKIVLLFGRLPRQCAHWLAMTRNSGSE